MRFLADTAQAEQAGNAWFASIRKAAEGVVKDIAHDAFRYVLYESPQYSGTFTANWKLSVGTPDTSYEIDPLGTRQLDANRRSPMFKRGDMVAINHAIPQLNNLPSFTLGQSVYISNSSVGVNKVSHEKFTASMVSPLAVRIEEGKIKLRDVNIGAAHMLARAAERAGNQYGNVTQAQAKRGLMWV